MSHAWLRCRGCGQPSERSLRQCGAVAFPSPGCQGHSEPPEAFIFAVPPSHRRVEPPGIRGLVGCLKFWLLTPEADDGLDLIRAVAFFLLFFFLLISKRVPAANRREAVDLQPTSTRNKQQNTGCEKEKVESRRAKTFSLRLAMQSQGRTGGSRCVALGCDPSIQVFLVFLFTVCLAQVSKGSDSKDGQHIDLLHQVAVWFFPAFPSAIVFPGRQSQLLCRSPVFVLSS